MWKKTWLLLPLCLLPSCAEKSGDDTEQTTSPHLTDQDAGTDEDAQTPWAPLLLDLELPLLVERSVGVQADGSYLWGEPVPIDGAEVCAIERREEFALFEPYEALDEPICVTSRAGEAPLLQGLLAHSDYTITAKKDGYLPLATTQRVESASLYRHSDTFVLQLVLLTEAQGMLFQRPAEAIDTADSPSAGAEEPGLLAIESGMYDITRMAPGPRDQMLSGLFFPAADAELDLSFEPGGEPLHLELPASQLLLSVPAGLYRAKPSHPRAFCEPLGTPYTFTFWGLGTDYASDLEARVLPGHVTLIAPVCSCVGPASAGPPSDGPACLFAEEPALDAGAP